LLAALVLGAAGLLVLGVQPLLYAAYVHAGGLDAAGLGRLAALEIAMLSLGCALGILLLKRLPGALLALAGVALLVAGNLLTDVALFPARLVAGAGGGLLVALAAAAIARQPNVDRVAAAFLFLQAATQYVALDLASAHVTAAPIERLLIWASLAALPLALALPAELGPLRTEESGRSPAPTRLGLTGLLVAALFVGSAVGIWAYLGLWLEGQGLAAEAVGRLLTLSLAGQMAGALAAIWLAQTGRSSSRALLAGLVLLAALAGLVLAGPAASVAPLMAALFGAAWMVATPALTGFLDEVDPARGSLPHAAAAQLMGAALLPPLVGLLAEGGSLARVMPAFALLLLLSLGLLLAARRRISG
jgi:MFS transporter, DHA1 family, inner membrane transport protein